MLRSILMSLKQSLLAVDINTWYFFYCTQARAFFFFFYFSQATFGKHWTRRVKKKFSFKWRYKMNEPCDCDSVNSGIQPAKKSQYAVITSHSSVISQFTCSITTLTVNVGNYMYYVIPKNQEQWSWGMYSADTWNRAVYGIAWTSPWQSAPCINSVQAINE